MIIVSNTSPILNLIVIGQLDLLKQLYKKVIIPGAVFGEISKLSFGLSDAEQLQALTWIEIREVTDRSLVEALLSELDPGEAEAIALAKELKADLLLMDERRGRRVASRLGLRFVGLLGILVEAKHKGLIKAVKPILDSLVTKAGFWLGNRLYTHILETVGE